MGPDVEKYGESKTELKVTQTQVKIKILGAADINDLCEQAFNQSADMYDLRVFDFARMLEAKVLEVLKSSLVATILPSDPYDDRSGLLWLSLEDRTRLNSLPAGTRLFRLNCNV